MNSTRATARGRDGQLDTVLPISRLGSDRRIANHLPPCQRKETFQKATTSLQPQEEAGGQRDGAVGERGNYSVTVGREGNAGPRVQITVQERPRASTPTGSLSKPFWLKGRRPRGVSHSTRSDRPGGSRRLRISDLHVPKAAGGDFRLKCKREMGDWGPSPKNGNRRQPHQRTPTEK